MIGQIGKVVKPRRPIIFTPSLTNGYMNKLWHKDFCQKKDSNGPIVNVQLTHCHQEK